MDDVRMRLQAMGMGLDADMENEIRESFASMEPEMPPWEWGTRIDYMSNYSFILPFERNWERVTYFPWFRRNGKKMAFGGTILYVLGILIFHKLMSYRKAGFNLRWLLTIYNLGMVVFSLCGFLRTMPELSRTLYRHGFTYSVCIGSIIEDQVALTWHNFYCWSKYFEFIDTLFLILRKRPVSFLHWFHHASVIVIAWHGAHTLTAAGRWFFTMNYGVHSAMYAYYTWRAFGYRCPRWISMSVTSLQLAQMIGGVFVGRAIVSVKLNGGVCHHTWENLYLALAIYLLYLYLFARYFYYAYLRPPAVKMSLQFPANCRTDHLADEAVDENVAVSQLNGKKTAKLINRKDKNGSGKITQSTCATGNGVDVRQDKDAKKIN